MLHYVQLCSDCILKSNKDILKSKTFKESLRPVHGGISNDLLRNLQWPFEEPLRPFKEPPRPFEESLRHFEESLRPFEESLRPFKESLRPFKESPMTF